MARRLRELGADLPYLDTKGFTHCLTDLRGYGRSMRLKSEYNEMGAVSETVQLADHLGWDKFHLIGFSMTSMVVEPLAVHVVERVKGRMAVDPVSAAGIKMSDSKRKIFIDVITNDDKCRALADRIPSHRLSREWQDVKSQLARGTRTREACAFRKSCLRRLTVDA